ncbi:MAG: DUF533 domain-containing protein [Actinomycetota bacterium]
MANPVKSAYTSEQITAWLRALLTIAWADGNFDEDEQQMIASLTQSEFAQTSVEEVFEPIAPEELAAILGRGTAAAENFLRTAVMVALADGIYSFCEDELLYLFCKALGLKAEIISALRHTLEDANPPAGETAGVTASPLVPPHGHHRDVLQPVKTWLDGWDIHEPRVARFICKMIPPQCPFERDIHLFGHKVVHIPPMCKLNPLYEQLVGLRFRALCYLADECHEDISPYC